MVTYLSLYIYIYTEYGEIMKKNPEINYKAEELKTQKAAKNPT